MEKWVLILAFIVLLSVAAFVLLTVVSIAVFAVADLVQGLISWMCKK